IYLQAPHLRTARWDSLKFKNKSSSRLELGVCSIRRRDAEFFVSSFAFVTSIFFGRKREQIPTVAAWCQVSLASKKLRSGKGLLFPRKCRFLNSEAGIYRDRWGKGHGL
ncbi:unnamed protein product, partial [Larinioides sclopetarius]